MHSEYVILAAVLQQRWLCEHAITLSWYIHCMSR